MPQVGDMQSVGTAGWWVSDVPYAAAPVIASVADNGDGVSGVAAVTGVDTACEVSTRPVGGSTWTLKATLTTDGNATLAGLTGGLTYEVMARNLVGGLYSEPALARLYIGPTTVTATGPFSLPLENLRTLLANAAAFQTLVGAATANEALASIYRAAKDNPDNSVPFAVVRWPVPAEWNRTSDSGGAANYFVESGAMEIIIQNPIPTALLSDSALAELHFLEQIGPIVRDMELLAGSGTYLNAYHFVPTMGPGRTHPKEKESRGQFYQVVIRVEYGVH